MALAFAAALSGCGKTISNSATEQLILSDAVDRAITGIDFSTLYGHKCYMIPANLKLFKNLTIVNAEYVESALRNQILAAGCVLVDSEKEADIILEPRIGALATDEHEVTYGIPSSNLLSQAAILVPTAPPVPVIPEISVAKKDDVSAAVRIAVFAYEARTGEPIWQSGNSTARSAARDTWLFGIGPFQSGSIYEKPRFAGARLKLPLIGEKPPDNRKQAVSLNEPFVYRGVTEPILPGVPSVTPSVAPVVAAPAVRAPAATPPPAVPPAVPPAEERTAGKPDDTKKK